jgi:hypothetical protein
MTRLAAILIVFVIATPIVPVPAAAQDSMHLTGAEFLSACTRASPEWISFCHGYVQAIFDGPRRPGEGICPPVGTTRTMIVETVVRQLVESPDIDNLSASSIVYAVLLKDYPCK